MTRQRFTGTTVVRRAAVGGILALFFMVVGWADGQAAHGGTAAPLSLRSDPVAARGAVVYLRSPDFTSALVGDQPRNYVFVPKGGPRAARVAFDSLNTPPPLSRCVSATLFEDGRIIVRPNVFPGPVPVTLRPRRTYRLLVQSTQECEDSPFRFRVTITKLAPIASTSCLISSRAAIRRYDALQSARATARRAPTAANRRAVARALAAARSALRAQARNCRT